MNPLSRCVHCLLVAAPLLTLAACVGDPHGDAEAATAAPDEDPCQFVDVAEAQSLVGWEIASAEPDGYGACNLEDSEKKKYLKVHFFRPAYDYWPEASAPLPGVGDAAYLGGWRTVQVKANGQQFFTQTWSPPKDGVVSPEVKDAYAKRVARQGERDCSLPTISCDEGEEAAYETGYRLAKMVAAKL
jgi:hypothetical protein